MNELRTFPGDWQQQLVDVQQEKWYEELLLFLSREYQESIVYPPQENIFTALAATPFCSVKVVLLGQDPYHRAGQAHGLSFSVNKGVRLPPSLRNIYKELQDDLGIPAEQDGYFMPWAKQGVLLLNTILTVREGAPLSHKGKGWERFTDAILMRLAARPTPLVFVLWGNDARKKKSLLENGTHLILESAHPSPFSARNGFFGSKPFSKINTFLENQGQTAIDWNLHYAPNSDDMSVII